jgi:hypothetical protein
VALAVLLVPSSACSAGGDRPDPAAARSALVAAWQRSQHATYTLEGRFRRTTSDGDRVVDDPLVVVARPPDRIALGFGSWDGVVGGRSVHCVRDGRHGAFTGCSMGGRVDRAAQLRDELDQLAELTAGRSPAYRVRRRGDRCFVVDVAPGHLPTPYGRRTRWCFDRATGARAATRTEHDGAVDEVVVARIRPRADPTDLPDVG